MHATVTSNGVETKVDFGTGRYSAFQCEVMRDANRLLGFDAVKSEKIARAAAADLGRHNAQVAVSIGRPNKDMEVTIREVSKMKGITITPALSFVRLIGQLNELHGARLQSGALVLVQTLDEWINKD